MFRRYRIKRNDYEQVLKWARAQKPDEAEDEKSAEPLGLSMPAQYLPKITWAHKAELQVRNVAHGKHALFVKDGATWKQLVHDDAVDEYLRDAMLKDGADAPMRRVRPTHRLAASVVRSRQPAII